MTADRCIIRLPLSTRLFCLRVDTLHVYYTVVQKCPYFCSTVVATNIDRFSIKFDTQYTEETCNTVFVDMSTSPA